MKQFLLLVTLSILLFISCKPVTIEQKEPIDLAKALLPEEEKRKVFYSYLENKGITNNYNIASSSKPDSTFWFYKFLNKYYPNDSGANKYGYAGVQYYAINEPFVNTNNIGKNRWLRLMACPAFVLPFVITIEEIDSTYYLTFKLAGYTNFHLPTAIYFSSKTTIKQAEFNDLFNYVDSVNFINTKQPDLNCSGLDPDYYSAEIIARNQYNKLAMLSSCPTSNKELALLQKVFKMVKRSRVFSTLVENCKDWDTDYSPDKYINRFLEEK